MISVKDKEIKGFTRNHLLSVTYDFLICYCEGNNLDSAINSFIIGRSLDADAFWAENGDTIDLFHRMMNDFDSKLGRIDSEIRYYFGAPDSEKKCEPIADMLVCAPLLHASADETIPEHIARLRAIPHIKYCELSVSFLYSYNNPSFKMPKVDEPCSTTADFIRYLLKLDIPEEVKWKLQDLFVNREKHLEVLERILTVCSNYLLEYEEELDRIFNRCNDYWAGRRAGKTLSEFIDSDFKILLSVNPGIEKYDVLPCLYPFVISLTFPDENSPINPYKVPMLKVGVCFGNAMPPNSMLVRMNPKANEDRLLEAIKLISDSSRYEILKYVKDTESYAAEIASHLGLTAATVSHHMGNLFDSGLVSTSKDSKKLYYRLNREILTKYLDYLEEQLVPDTPNNQNNEN